MRPDWSRTTVSIISRAFEMPDCAAGTKSFTDTIDMKFGVKTYLSYYSLEIPQSRDISKTKFRFIKSKELDLTLTSGLEGDMASYVSNKVMTLRITVIANNININTDVSNMIAFIGGSGNLKESVNGVFENHRLVDVFNELLYEVDGETYTLSINTNVPDVEGNGPVECAPPNLYVKTARCLTKIRQHVYLILIP